MPAWSRTRTRPRLPVLVDSPGSLFGISFPAPRPVVAAPVIDYTGRLLLPHLPLTDRQFEVALLIRDGLQNKEIARKLGITTHAIKAHIDHIFLRLSGVDSRTALGVWAERRDPQIP